MINQYNTPTIAIIGGGFCGTMVAVHLLRQSAPVRIVLINSRYPLSKGIAYSSYSNKHLLNVPAKNMGAFPENPGHFIEWLKNHENYGVLDAQELPDMYLPRNIYGQYLKDIFENAIRRKTQNVSIEFVHDVAIDLSKLNDAYQVHFSVSPPIIVNKVVLAMGNHIPRDPEFGNTQFVSSKRYFPNPWLKEAVNHPEKESNILIVGNGLTMVDVVLGLRENGFTGKIYSLSPHGFKILPHRKFEPYKKMTDELQKPFKLNDLVGLFRKHVAILRAENKSAEAIVDSFRPLTQKVWKELSSGEKRRFLYHLRHMWGVARHRLPMQIHKEIQQLILDDKLEIIAGKIEYAFDKENYAEINIRRRYKNEILQLNVDRVINCTGPESNINKMSDSLIKNLLATGMIQADEFFLGINATEDGQILGKSNLPEKNILTLGTWMKGVLWESTAIPELRNQAKSVANQLIVEFV